MVRAKVRGRVAVRIRVANLRDGGIRTHEHLL